MFSKKLHALRAEVNLWFGDLSSRISVLRESLDRRISTIRDAQGKELAQHGQDISGLQTEMGLMRDAYLSLVQRIDHQAALIAKIQTAHNRLIEKTRTAIDLLAQQTGNEFYLTEEVPAKFEFTPGVPSHLDIRKTPKGKKG